MSALLPKKTEKYPEPSNIEFSLGVLIHRLSTLPKEDCDDLYLLVRQFSSTSTEEEVESIRQAMLEILDQKDGRVENFDFQTSLDSVNVRWKDFISEKVKTIRVGMGLTQSELAARSGIPQSHVSRIENGVHSPSRKTLEKLAAALEVPLSHFDPSNETEC